MENRKMEVIGRKVSAVAVASRECWGGRHALSVVLTGRQLVGGAGGEHLRLAMGRGGGVRGTLR